MTRVSPLPDDVQTLKAMLLSQEAALRERDAQMLKLQETVNSQQVALASRAAEVEHLKLLIAKLRRMQFGRKSEKLDHQIEQLELRLEELEADEGAAPVEIPKTPRAVVEQAPRKPLPEHLPREIRTHLPESAGKCSECGGEMKSLGEDVAEQLEYVPASFRVIRHVRPKFACVCCDHIAQAPAPSRPIERGLAGPGLLAQVLVSKFADHVPLYAVGHVRPGRRRAGSLAACEVGRSRGNIAAAACRNTACSRDVGDETARGRHASSSAGTGQRQDEDRSLVGLRSR